MTLLSNKNKASASSYSKSHHLKTSKKAIFYPEHTNKNRSLNKIKIDKADLSWPIKLQMSIHHLCCIFQKVYRCNLIQITYIVKLLTSSLFLRQIKQPLFYSKVLDIK